MGGIAPILARAGISANSVVRRSRPIAGMRCGLLSRDPCGARNSAISPLASLLFSSSLNQPISRVLRTPPYPVQQCPSLPLDPSLPLSRSFSSTLAARAISPFKSVVVIFVAQSSQYPSLRCSTPRLPHCPSLPLRSLLPSLFLCALCLSLARTYPSRRRSPPRRPR